MAEDTNQPTPLPNNLRLPWEAPAPTNDGARSARSTNTAEPRDDVAEAPRDDRPVEDRVQDHLATAKPATEGEAMASVGQEPIQATDDEDQVHGDPDVPAADDEVDADQVIGDPEVEDDRFLELDAPRDIRAADLKHLRIIDENGKSMGRPLEQRRWTEKTQQLAQERRELGDTMATHQAALAMIAKSNPEMAAEAQQEVKRIQGELQQLNSQAVQHQQRVAVQDFMSEHSIAPERLTHELTAMDKAARSYGFTTEELAGVADSRLLNLLRDVARHNAGGDIKSKKVVTTDPQRVHRPSAKTRHPKGSRSSSRFKSARQAQKQTGSLDSGAAAAHALLGLGEE